MAKYLTWEKQRQRWVYQRRIPETLRAAFGGRTTIRQHLGDIPEADAVARARQLATHHDALFAQKARRCKKPKKPDPARSATIRFVLDEETGERFIQTWRTRVTQDFIARLEPLRQQPDSAWDRCEEDIAATLAAARRDLRKGSHEPLQQALQSIQSELNIRLEGGDAEMAALLHAFNGSRVSFLVECLAVVRGDLPVNTLSPAPQAQLPLLDLWGDPATRLAEEWQARLTAQGEQANPKTLDKYRQIASDLGTVLARRPVQALNRSDVDALQALWTARGNAPITLKDKLSILRTMLRPFDTDGRITSCFVVPAGRKRVRSVARLPFTDAQLRLFLGKVMHDPAVRHEDRMLLALLILLGTRLEEIYQLRAEDLEPCDTGWLVRIADHRDTGTGDARLKNQASARRLPLRAGVIPELDAWLSERREAGGHLFPDGSTNQYGTRGDAAGKRLNRILRSLFPDDRRLVLQSTRSTANRVMRRADTDTRIRHRFLGHADTGIHDQHYDPGALLDDRDLEAGSFALAAFLRDVLGSESRSLV